MTKRSEANFEKDMLRRLKAAGSPWPSQVDLEIEPWTRRGTSSRSTGDSSNGQPHFRVRLLWNRGRYEFVAEAKNRSTPSVIETAVQQAKRYADQVGLPRRESPALISQVTESSWSPAGSCCGDPATAIVIQSPSR